MGSCEQSKECHLHCEIIARLTCGPNSVDMLFEFGLGCAAVVVASTRV